MSSPDEFVSTYRYLCRLLNNACCLTYGRLLRLLPFLANVNSLFAVARPSLVCLSSDVCRLYNARTPYAQAVEVFGNISMAFGTLAIH